MNCVKNKRKIDADKKSGWDFLTENKLTTVY